MPFVVLLDGGRAWIKGFREHKIGCPVESGMSGKHHCDAREKLRVAKLSPEFRIRRKMRAKPDKGLFRISIRGHLRELRSTKLESGCSCHQQLDERIPVPQSVKDSIAF